MHEILKSSLPRAKGSSDHIVVIFLDVRGFSSFAGTAESINAALFLRTVYTRILERFFPRVTFFKLTGDGMMIIREYDQDDLVEIVNESIAKSIELVAAFPTLCQGDEMINFPVPQFLGIGIARGAATRLSGETNILDYSGRPLNLAARLMDFARPAGVVFSSENLGKNIIAKELLNLFTEDHVYVKGISESVPLSIHYETSNTQIESSSRLPINKYATRVIELEPTNLETVRTRGDFFNFLPEKPAHIESCKIFFSYPRAGKNGKKHPTDLSYSDFKAHFGYLQGQPGVTVKYDEVYESLKNENIRGTWEITSYIEYEVIDD